MKELRKKKCRVVLWILETFCTSPSFRIKAITGLIQIHLYLQLRTQSFLSNYIVKLFLKKRYSDISRTHCLSLENITLNQQLNVKGSIVNANNRLNGIFPSFNSLNCKFSLSYRLINMFLVIFCFILWIRKAKIVELYILTNSIDVSSKLWLI